MFSSVGDRDDVCGTTWNIHIENFAPNGQGERCLVNFVDAQTSKVIARRSLDCRFVSQASIRELAHLLNTRYCTEALRVVRLSRLVQHASRRTVLALQAIQKDK